MNVQGFDRITRKIPNICSFFLGLLAKAAFYTGIQNEILEGIHKKSTVISKRGTVTILAGIRIEILEEFYTYLLGWILG